MIKSQSELARELSKIKGFVNPKLSLRQYLTPANIAGGLLWTAYMNGDINGRVIYDLGCGTGILGIGAGLLGAESVKCFDVDSEALDTARSNALSLGLKNVEFIQCDITLVKGECDTVVMNPPFMVKGGVNDKVFLETAFKLSGRVYSIHNIETAGFIKKFSASKGFKSALISDYSFPLSHAHEFHEKEVVNFRVGVWQFMK